LRWPSGLSPRRAYIPCGRYRKDRPSGCTEVTQCYLVTRVDFLDLRAILSFGTYTVCMKLYAHPNTPRCHPFYTPNVTPGHAYALLHQLLAAYNEVLYTWWNPEALYLACFGDLMTRPTRNGQLPAPRVITKRLQAIEERLGYEVPELLEYLQPVELETAAAIFCAQPLPAFILHVLSLERMLHRRLDEPCDKRLNDESHAKAAGLGKGERSTSRTVESVRIHEPESSADKQPLVLTLPALTVVRQLAPVKCTARPQTPQAVLHQVKRAQERRRLKRKRR